MPTNGLEDRMYGVQDLITGEIGKKATAGRKLGEYQRTDTELTKLGDAAMMFFAAYKELVKKAKLLKNSIESDLEKKDPKTYATALEQMKVYNEFVNTYIEPARTYVSAIYKSAIVKPLEDTMKDTDELLDTKQTFQNKMREANDP